MLKTLKEMQEKGVFKLISYSDMDLDAFINNATSEEEIEQNLSIIQNYIKNLDSEYSYIYNVPISKHISDFCDKFQFTMFDMYTSNLITKGTIYEKDLNFNKGGICKFGISSNDNVKFTIQERKLLKLINHHYIKLREKNNNSDIIYIPLDKLKSIYAVDVNNLAFRNSIVETCIKLNNKQVYWDMENTKYYKTKDLKHKKLSRGNKEKLVDITILYLPRLHQKNKNGYVNSIMGIICNVNNFMKLRYEIKHIGNDFPTDSLRCKYLDFVIMEKIIFQLNLNNRKNSGKLKTLEERNLPDKVKDEITFKIKNEYKKTLVDLTRELYYYDNGEQIFETYFSKICNEPNSKRRIVEIINSLARVALLLYENNHLCIKLYIKNKLVNIITKSKSDTSIEVIDGKKIYDNISNLINKDLYRGQVIKFLRDGEIGVYIKL